MFCYVGCGLSHVVFGVLQLGSDCISASPSVGGGSDLSSVFKAFACYLGSVPCRSLSGFSLRLGCYFQFSKPSIRCFGSGP